MSARNSAKCFYCSTALADPMDVSNPRASTRDHVVPKVMLRGAGWLFPNEWHNLNRVPCCTACNTAKGDMPPYVWCRQLSDPAAKARLYNRLVAMGIPADALLEAMA